jgi:glycosyltransferase involved in cell wall biosynthesis
MTESSDDTAAAFNASRARPAARGDRLRVLAWPAFENKTGNPYNRLLYEAVEEEGVTVDEFRLSAALRGGYDLWHVHWPDDFLSYAAPVKAATYVAAELVLMALAKARGTRIVWTAHDLGPHESRHPWLERLFWQFFPPLVDGVISLSEAGRKKAREQFPALRGVPAFVVPHGHYRPAYPDAMAQAEARAALELDTDAPTALFVGRIRPYKNVPHLIRVFQQLEAPEARLLVVGNPATETVRRAVEDAAAGAERVQTALRFVPDDAMPTYCAAADLVVLPYRDILHSGSALLALSFDRPVLVPDQGAMSELQNQVGPEWVRAYAGTLTPAVLRDALQWARRADRPARAPLDALAWPRLARKTVEAYRAICT